MASVLASAWRVQAVDDVSQRFTQPHMASHGLAWPRMASHGLTPSRAASHHLVTPHAVSRRLVPLSQRNAGDDPPLPPEMRVKTRHATSAVTRTAVNSTTSSTAFHRSVMRTAHNQRATSRRQRIQLRATPCDSVQLRATPRNSAQLRATPRRSDLHSTHERSRARGHDASRRFTTLEMLESLHHKAACMRVQVRPSSTAVCMHPGSPQLCDRVLTTTNTCDWIRATHDASAALAATSADAVNAVTAASAATTAFDAIIHPFATRLSRTLFGVC
jgi:hypothetical protein